MWKRYWLIVFGSIPDNSLKLILAQRVFEKLTGTLTRLFLLITNDMYNGKRADNN